LRCCECDNDCPTQISNLKVGTRTPEAAASPRKGENKLIINRNSKRRRRRRSCVWHVKENLRKNGKERSRW